MKNVSSDLTLKATVGALVVYATAMGLIGAYYAAQCGSHWFTYCVLSFLPFAVPAAVVVYFVLRWLLSEYDFGNVRYWLIAGGIACVFFVGCFVFAHLQPALPLYNGNGCQPFEI
jgi:hypothetical protein